MKKYLLLFFTLCILFPSVIFPGTTGKLVGKIIDAGNGEPLPFVNITLEGTMIGAATDLDGSYVILNIPPGRYSVKVQYIGYQTQIIENVVISIDLTTRQDFQLNESSVELGEIVVQAQVDVLKKDVTSSQSLVSSEDIKNLPVVELNDVLQLQAGVTKDAGGNFHIRGGRSSEISYKVNGISVTDAYDNSRGIELDNSSIQEVQVISGTFNAEHGNALSGIINAVTKEGGQKLHGGVHIYSSDYVSNFTDYFPNIDDYNPVANYNFQASLSGPIPLTENKVTFFANGRYNYDDGYISGFKKFSTMGDTLNGEAVPMNWSKRYIGQANISYFASSHLKFNLEGLYSTEDYKDYTEGADHEYKYLPDGDVTKYFDSYNATLTLTHTLSSSSFYTFKASLFKNEFKEYVFEDPYDSRYLPVDSLNRGRVDGYSFRTMGTNLHRFFRETNTKSVKFDFTSQVSENHMLKFGAEGKIHTLKFDDYDLVAETQPDGSPIEPFQPKIPDADAVTRDLYDESPFEFSAYVQDKIEFEAVIINLGLRFDYFDSRGNVLVDPTDPNIYLPLREGLDELSFAERESYFYKDATAKYQFSPRFGVAYPISPTGVIHFSYGHFLQIPSMQYLYDRAEYKVPRVGEPGEVFGNPDLEPQKTIMYEIGFRQEFFDNYVLDLTMFYRDIRNWISSSAKIITRNLVGYSMYVNKDYANVKGITLNLNKRFGSGFAFDVNYTYQVAEGSNSRPEEEFEAIRDNRQVELFLTPLEWDQRHILNASFYVGGDDWGSSIIARYGTGLPYTPSITQYTADRGITTGLMRNSRFRPAQFTVDWYLNKTFNVFDYDLNVYVKVFNLLDSKVIVNVFGDTGKPDYTTTAQNIGEDPARPNTVAEYLKYPHHYGEPRLVQFGVEFSF